MTPQLAPDRAREILTAAKSARVFVVGDVMLDQFIWGAVSRISPEAPVPVVDFQRESFMPGGAANVARNLVSLAGAPKLFGAIGHDEAADRLQALLKAQHISCAGLIKHPRRHTSVKTRVVAHQQQVVRIDRESRGELEPSTLKKLLAEFNRQLPSADAVIVGDYGKGVISQPLLNQIKSQCHRRGVWLSLDPKPVHQLNLNGVSLLTPNRKETFELAGVSDATRHEDPLADKNLMQAADFLLREIRPAVLLITLGELGMLLCQRNQSPFHIPTVAQEVFDVSGAGDTVIATFTMAIAGGASPKEAAMISNHAAGIVVGKVGTATASTAELLASFFAKVSS